MKNIQQRVQKTLKENNVDLSSEDILLGIYEELSNLTRHTLTQKGTPSSNPTRSIDESLGELGALVLELCSENGLEFEEVVGNYLESVS